FMYIHKIAAIGHTPRYAFQIPAQNELPYQAQCDQPMQQHCHSCITRCIHVCHPLRLCVPVLLIKSAGLKKPNVCLNSNTTNHLCHCRQPPSFTRKENACADMAIVIHPLIVSPARSSKSELLPLSSIK